MSAIQQLVAGLGGVTPPPGQVVYSVPGTYEFVIPQGITSISLVGVSGGGAGDNGNTSDGGGGGGAGGKLAYANNITVTPGQVCDIVIGAGGSNTANTSFEVKAPDGGNTTVTIGSTSISIPGGMGGSPYGANPGAVGTLPSNPSANVAIVYSHGGSGGGGYNGGGGGGGAGGYGGNGGDGAYSLGGNNTSTVGSGGGGGGGAGTSPGLSIGGGGTGGTGNYDGEGGGGGGANLFSSTNPPTNGAPGNSLSSPGSKGGDGGWPGGGGGGSYDNGYGFTSKGGDGAVRIVWPGSTRQFPSTNVTDV